MPTSTRKRWIRTGAALASIAAVAAGSLVAAGPASAANKVIPVAPAPYFWSDSAQFGTDVPLPVAADATTLTVELPDSTAPDTFTEWSYPGYRVVEWRLGSTATDLASGESVVDTATNSIEIPIGRAAGSFGGTSLSLLLNGAEDEADDAYAPAGVDRTGFVLALSATLAVTAASGSTDADLDLSTSASSDRAVGGEFWAGGGTVTEAGAGDVIVLDSGVPGFFDLAGLSATVGTEDGGRLKAAPTVVEGGRGVAIRPTQEFFDRYLNFSDTSPLGAPSVEVKGLSRGGEQPAGTGVVVRAPLRVVPSTTTPTPTPTSGTGPEVVRLAGTDRQGTAVEISKVTFTTPGVPVVYIATGANFPDALSAGPAAAKEGGPLLLVDRDSVSQVVRDELTRLKPQRIVVVGSDLSVSDALATDLGQYANGRVFRLGGTDRYDTSRKIIESAFGGGSPKGAWLATGEKFPDALSAAAAAGKNKAPVVLVNGGLPAADPTTVGILTGLRPPALTIAGSELSVSAGIQNSLTVPRGPVVTRLGGVDRYDTSLQLNRAAFPRGAKTVFLATGENFPDALAGAAAAGYAGSPLFTVPPTCVPVDVLKGIRDGGTTKVVLLGGEGTLSKAVKNLTPCS
ncbi:cell wall-binding repeat-containing protein [Rathayibacter sp. AY2B3]|uniref:cell wall-binding repeat-containing protein n=1 Tax=Rathayibacter sp. AY2B3 TaxID=2080569 RepID=UPI0015E2B129|nr:cell wall-binding repeat-containing protein [Rathayibacter sp. AY2B3]